MDFAGVSKKRLYLSNTIEEMNCMVEKKLKDIDSKTLREYSIRNDFVSAQQAMRIGDEELAYVLYSLAIHRFVHLRDYITKVDFSDSEQDECIRRLDELSKSLIKRYNEQIVGLINTPTSSQQKPANKIIIKAMHNPKSPSIFAKIKRFFSGKSENTVKYTSVETGIEALNLTQRLTSTRGNGEDESQKMILTLQEYKNRLAEIRRGVEAKKRKEATSEHENQKQQAKINELTKFKPTSSKFNNQTKNIHSVSEVKHNKLNFSGFPPQCTEEYVRKLFNTYGQITKFIPSKLANGQFGGFGEIEYKTREAAEKAVKSMSGVIITGKRISVSFNEPNNHQVNKPVVDYTNIHPLIKIVPKSPQEIAKPADNRRRDRSSNRKEEKADNRVLFVKFSTEDISSEEKLRSLFARFGNIRYANIGRNANGSKTNFGKVCFFNAEHTNSAILEMNNYTFHSGKKLSVSRYRFNTAITDQAPNDTKQAKKQSHSISNESDFTNIYVKNFKDLYRNERELSEAFLKFGAIKSARVMRDNKNESLGWGFVCFYNHFNAKTAVEQMNNTVINDHRLFVRRAYNNYDKKKNLRNQFLEQRSNKIRASKYSGAKSKVKQTCIVCFTENSSAESCILDCQHVICKECIVLYIQHLVDNKEVESIICPKDGCHCELSFNHIQKTIPSHLLKEYDRCLVDNYLNKRDDIVWCPIADCRCPVFVTKNMTEGRCPKCKFAFCTKCGEKYHGISECNGFKNEDEKTLVVNRYMYGSLMEKAELERKYTKKKLENEVENVLSNHCIKRKCKQCPNCNVNIEKNEGCNKIICTKCKTYFCWLCLQILDKLDPFKHFNERGSRCTLLPMHLLI